MNILTFDIEEWFHILDNNSTKTEKEWVNYEVRIHRNMDKIFHLLDETDTQATFFCLGWIAEKYPEIIRRIDRAGYEIGTHSHLHQLAYEQNRKIYTEDLKRSIDLLESITGKKIRAYRAPGFSIKEENQWALEVLIENGIEIDCSIFPAPRAHGGFQKFQTNKPCIIQINGMDIKEFPINTYNQFHFSMIFSGGGYFRALPQSFINYCINKSNYTMAYFHPRDFDYTQPLIEDLSLLRRFKSYYGLKECYPKLKTILTKNTFISLNQANDIIDWDRVDKVVL